MRRVPSTPCSMMACILFALAAATLVATPLAAQGWSGSVGLAVVGQSTSGSESSFRTQANLDEGFVLEELLLRYGGAEDSDTELTLKAWGFGNTEPDQHFELELELDAPWSFNLSYDRRESFFQLTESELGLRRDDWEVDRWRAGVVWDGWRAARLRLDLRHTLRDGTVQRPFFGLNTLYPLAVEVDESFTEAALSLETKTTPVKLVLEQALATYERDNRRRPAGSLNLDGDDPDLFAVASDSRSEKRDVPTTRVMAIYGSERFEILGSLVWRPAELDSSGTVAEGYDIGGGDIGRVEFIDTLTGSGDMDTLAGNFRLGVRLGSSWTLRLESDYRDTSTDATLVGERLLRLSNPRGDVLELPASIEDSSFLDVTDSTTRLTLEWSGGDWSLWAGGFLASRDVDWRIGEEGEDVDVSRDSDGALVGVAWSRGRVKGSAEIEHGSFDRFIFATDPETVDRLTLRLQADLGGGWDGHLYGRLEEADNPASVSDLDHSSDGYGLGVAWTSTGGGNGFGLDLDVLDLATETGLLLPTGGAGLSVYDLSLVTLTAHGRAELGRARLSGSATRIEDSGDTWPVESWVGRARLGFAIPSDAEIALFGEYWSYDEERAGGDDYDVTRYGLAFNWRFE